MKEECPLLLDTCAVVWITNEQRIADGALDAITRAHVAQDFIYVSPITAWEIGLLISRGSMSSPLSPQRWFQRVMQAPGIRLADMSPEILIASSYLPGNPPRDPADRIIAATAREHNYVLMTRDQPLLDYAVQGHIQAIAC